MPSIIPSFNPPCGTNPTSITADRRPTVDIRHVILQTVRIMSHAEIDKLLDDFASTADLETSQAMPGGVGTPKPGFQSNQSAAQRALKRGVNYSHQAMIDLIIQCPGISQNDIAAHFGYSVSWISTLMASDAFQSQLAKRREEIVDPMLIATAEERFKGIALRAADLIAERLAQLPDKIPDTFLLRSFELSSRAAGYGARQEPPAPPPAEIHVHLEKLGANLDSLLNRRRIAAQDAIDVEVDQAPSGA